ncbi:MAG: hypothetical protein RLY45_1957 [Actinomycetota bacterium]
MLTPHRSRLPTYVLSRESRTARHDRQERHLGTQVERLRHWNAPDAQTPPGFGNRAALGVSDPMGAETLVG